MGGLRKVCKLLISRLARILANDTVHLCAARIQSDSLGLLYFGPICVACRIESQG